MKYEQKYNRLLIFDGSHALHRALSVPNNWQMQTSMGVKTGGVFGVLRTILKELTTYNYFPIVVFDGGLSKRRLELYPNYKHTVDKQEKQLLIECKQEKTEEELLEEEYKYEYNAQREILKQLLPYFNIPVVCFESWEGDDLIYILTKLAKDSIVVSDDKDLLQLIREDETGRCRVRRAMRDEFWDMSKLKEESFNVENYIINKAIVGDGSDNIPSACYGVGEKTASDLYSFYSYIKDHNIEYPQTEESLTEVCKKHNLNKRKAFINFNENQFLVNLMLTDLKLVDEDISNLNPEMLCNIEDIINLFLLNTYNNVEQLENIKSALDYLEIQSFDYLNMYSIINTLKNVANNNDTTLPETNTIKTNKLF